MALQFLTPLSLLALLSLPLLWWLLRATPPAPLRVFFPPMRFLRDVKDDEETPDSAPLWLRLLRLCIATLVILALASPVWSPRQNDTGDGPLILVVDNGWASASAWPAMQKNALALTHAGKQRMAVLFSANTDTPKTGLRFITRAAGREQIKDHRVRPWPPQRLRAVAQIEALKKAGGIADNTRIVWLSDGLDHGHAREVMDAMARIAPAKIYTPGPQAQAVLMAAPKTTARGLQITAHRADPAQKTTMAVQAMDTQGAVLAGTELVFETGQKIASADMILPLQMRNRLGLLQLPNARSAGASWVFDGGWATPLVGLITPGGDTDRQPLLSGFYYLQKALAPHAQIVRDRLDALLAQKPAVLVLTDPAGPTEADMEKLDGFVQAGGLLIRFAGPHLAVKTDALVPVNLRAGGRLMGGAFGWEVPQALAPFATNSPFYGLDSGKDAAVRRQVLALPDASINDKVWARLQDGTPLVSSAPRGAGRIVLFHVTASPDWSDLPLSGLFAAMLERTLAFANNTKAALGEAQNGRWVLEKTLGPQGVLKKLENAGATAFLPANADFADVEITMQTPAGLYQNGPFSRALNLGSSGKGLTALPAPPAGVTLMSDQAARIVAFKAPFLALALVLFGLDTLAALWLAGRLRNLKNNMPRRNNVAVLLFAALLGIAATASNGRAEDRFERAIKAAQATQLAYIVTGDRRVDEMSKAGLFGLSATLTQRTTVEPVPPAALDPAVDDLSVYSFIYWPVLRPPELSDKAIAALDDYLKNGGMLVIDTQDGGLRARAAGGVDPALSAVFSSISVPPLRPIDPNHVLNRTYYLIHEYPGRLTKGRLWVEADARGSSLDGVSGIIAGSNDWSAAWAINTQGQPIAALSDDIPRQREMARRFGVNLVMYALAGSYKADQVHIPALLERLGKP
jgi:Domain of unknown function (DUF4159)/Aerotolerance regulator N-terminal